MSGDQYLKAVDVVVRGHVQGVGFRYRTMWAADEQGVAGWVRNEYDGSVKIHVEGVEHRVDMFLQTLRRGFPGAQVSRLETSRSTPEGLRDFKVVH